MMRVGPRMNPSGLPSSPCVRGRSVSRTAGTWPVVHRDQHDPLADRMPRSCRLDRSESLAARLVCRYPCRMQLVFVVSSVSIEEALTHMMEYVLVATTTSISSSRNSRWVASRCSSVWLAWYSLACMNHNTWLRYSRDVACEVLSSYANVVATKE